MRDYINQLATTAGQNWNWLGNQLGNTYNQLTTPPPQVQKMNEDLAAGNMQAINRVGKFVGNLPIGPPLPGTPTISQLYGGGYEEKTGLPNIGESLGLPVGSFLAGQMTPEEAGGGLANAGLMFMGAMEPRRTPVSEAAIEEMPSGRQLTRAGGGVGKVKLAAVPPGEEVRPVKQTFPEAPPQEAIPPSPKIPPRPVISSAELPDYEPSTIEAPPTKAGVTVKPPNKTVVRIPLEATIKGAEDTKAAQFTLNTEVGGNTATEQYNNLQPTMNRFGNQIQEIMKSDPKSISVNHLSDLMEQNLSSLGMPTDISNPQAEQIYRDSAAKYVARLQGKATIGLKDANGNPYISDVDLYNTKKLANAEMKRAMAARNTPGVQLTQDQRFALAYRDALDQALTEAHPDVKDLTIKQSHLYDAVDPVTKAAEAEQQGAFTQANKPPMTTGEKWLRGLEIGGGIGGVLAGGKALNVPVGSVAGAGIKAFSDLLGGNQGLPSGTLRGTSPTPTGALNLFPDQVPDNSGHYQLSPVSTPSATFMTEQQREQLESGLTPGTPEYQKIEQKFEQDQKMAKAQYAPEVADFMQRAPSAMVGANSLYDSVGTLPVGVFNKFKTFSDAAKVVDPRYQRTATYIDALNNGFQNLYKTTQGVDPSPDMLISTQDTPEQMRQKIQFATNFFAGTWSRYKDAYATVTSPSGTLNPQGQPVGSGYQPPNLEPQPLPSGMLQSASGLPTMNFPTR